MAFPRIGAWGVTEAASTGTIRERYYRKNFRAIRCSTWRDSIPPRRHPRGYRKKEILRGVSIDVRTGEVMLVIGLNGAGKSTLLGVASGILPAWEGSVWLDNENITAWPTYLRARRGIGYVMQGGKVFADLTVRESMELSRERFPSSSRITQSSLFWLFSRRCGTTGPVEQVCSPAAIAKRSQSAWF